MVRGGRQSGALHGRERQNLIGVRLRAVRRERGLSLRALGEKVGVTASLISQIENGQAKPSVDTLVGLAEQLLVPTCYFFGEVERVRGEGNASGSRVVRCSERRQIELAQGVVWESLLPSEEPDHEWLLITYPPGAVSAETMQVHNGRDYITVISGNLSLALAFTEYQLGPGDSICFEGSTPHQLRNEGDVPMRAVVNVLRRNNIEGSPLGSNDRAPHYHW